MSIVLSEPSLERLGAAFSLALAKADTLPECTVMHEDIEIPARYETSRDGAYLRAIKINGFWVDPIKFGFSYATISTLERQCEALEDELAGDDE